VGWKRPLPSVSGSRPGSSRERAPRTLEMSRGRETLPATNQDRGQGNSPAARQGEGGSVPLPTVVVRFRHTEGVRHGPQRSDLLRPAECLRPPAEELDAALAPWRPLRLVRAPRPTRRQTVGRPRGDRELPGLTCTRSRARLPTSTAAPL